MMSLLAALLVLLGLAQSPQEPDSLTRNQVIGPLGAQLDSQLTAFAAYGFSGTVLVARDGGIVLLKGYGQADVKRGIANTAATRFEMNSMTKMFTAAAILQLAAQNRLRLTDPVARYLGGFPAGKQGATIEQLATHTAGLIVKGAELAGDSREAFIRDVARTPRESAPGERYRYTNAGFSLLAAIIETVSGETYHQYLGGTSSRRQVCELRHFVMRWHRTIHSLRTVTSAHPLRSSLGHRTRTPGARSARGECGRRSATVLLFIGIHNAWDAVTYAAIERFEARPEAGDKG